MAEESLLQRQLKSLLSLKNNPAIQGIGEQFSYDNIMDLLGEPAAVISEFANSKDRTIPGDVLDQIIQQGKNIVPNIAIGAENTATGIQNILSADSSIVRGLKDGTISEQELLDSGYDFTGIDLADVLPSSEFGPSVPEEFINVPPGKMNIFDPTGDGITKNKNKEIQGLLDDALNLSDFDFTTQLDIENTEKFRKDEEDLVNNLQGGLNSMTGAESERVKAESEVLTKQDAALTKKDAEEGFMSAMDDFFENARGTGPEVPKKRTIEEYKKAFSEATGIDVSGKVDKSAFLMSIGLGLLQNKAGKNFNVSKLLEASGKAVEEALPALEKAKEKAYQGALAGGKYALQTQSADKAVRAAAEEKMLNRDKYWVYKKGTSDKPFQGFETGQFEDLNKYELDKLMKDPKFQEQYDFVSSADRMSVLEKRAEGLDLGDEWGNFERISLIGGKADEMPPELQILAAPADANYGGTASAGFKLAEKPETVMNRFMGYQQSINSGSAKMEKLLEKLNTGVTIPKQFLSSANQILVSFGIGETSNITEAKRLLKNIAIDEATAILKESGKTLSDNDRKLVAQRVGAISWGSADLQEIKNQLEDIYDLTVLKPQRNLDTAVSWLEQNAGIKFGGGSSGAPTKAEVDAMNKVYGTSYTLDDFK